MGDPAGFDELVRRHQGAVAGYFRNVLLDAHRAEDLAQETFLKIFRERLSYRPEGRFRQWLFRIAHNLAMDEFSRRKVRAERPLEEAPDDRPRPPEVVARDEELRRVFEAMGDLPPVYREALSLAWFQELSYVEIASLTGTTPGNVAVRVHTALQKLKAKFS
ncbi:MAG: RNA polymerase sigma-70 factor ECF [Planctomycetota bacterium]|nr:MAG: RNA polymerase sigma-70 factor ECF [Planctomycetota bacterium]